jgi:phosphatidylinositol glycan class O
MDDKTTLLIFGDHGMTEDGNHGGDSLLELSTVIFAY